MAKAKKDEKKVSKPRSARAGSVGSTFSKEGSVEVDREGGGLTKESPSKTKISDVEENINGDEITEDSDSEENDISDEGKPTPKIKAGDAESRSYIPESTQKPGVPKFKSTDLTLNKIWIGLTISVVILAISVCVLFAQSNTDQNKDGFAQLKTNIFSVIKNNFPTQKNELWYKFFSGIKYVNLSNPTKPAVFLLIHNNSNDVAECLAWNIGKAASNFLKTPGIIEVLPESAKYYINNELISNYKEELKRKGVMIIYKLDQLSGLVAKSLHAFCDTYNPLVNRAVLLFTINDFYGNETMTANKKAQELMKTLWKDKLMDSTLDALITRLTDTVLEIKSEKHVNCPKNLL